MKVLLLLAVLLLLERSEAIAPCTGEQPDACGFLPSTYANLSLVGEPALCDANCTLEGGFDRCGVCGGIAPLRTQVRLTPVTLDSLSRIGGSVANWNGTVAVSQHIAQEHPPLVAVPVVTWNLDPVTGTYGIYVLPASTDGTNEYFVPKGVGYGLRMSENYLVVGVHATIPKVLQLWVKTESPPWSWLWTANDPCPGTDHYFGFSVGVDERIPKGPHPGNYGVVVAGNPAAHFSGRVYVYMTYSPGLLQEISIGSLSNETWCFGESVSADSGLLAVGAPSYLFAGQDSAGSVFIYKWDPTLGLQGLYDNVTQITPPSPAVNGGFGVSVAVWDDLVVIGDNTGTIYLYQIVGLVAVPLLLEQPAGLNLATRNGYAVSIWDEYIASGDEDFIPEASARGATFIWDKNPLLTPFYRTMYRLNDTVTSLSTRYGASVDNRGGCYVASGISQQLPYGGVYVQNLCRDDCYGCDDVINSCIVDDACGVCDGDNTTCLDCLGVIEGTAVLDACNVCNGANNTCVVVPNITALIDCNGTINETLTHGFQSLYGPATYTLVAPFATKGTAQIVGQQLLYTGDPYVSGTDVFAVNASLTTPRVWSVFYVTVNIDLCLDCLGVLDGPTLPDECGVCGGDNSTCLGCDGVPNSGAVDDYCGVCNGDNSTCVVVLDINTTDVLCTAQLIFHLSHEPAAVPVLWSIVAGPVAGIAEINPITGVAIWFNPGAPGGDWFVVQATSVAHPTVFGTSNVTFIVEDCTDCNGDFGGTQLIDLCGVCGGDSSSCADCLGVPNGVALPDVCGVCNGDGSTCLDCFGVPGGPAVVDICGVCGGDESTCVATGGVGGLPLGLLVVFLIGLLILIGRFGPSMVRSWIKTSKIKEVRPPVKNRGRTLKANAAHTVFPRMQRVLGDSPQQYPTESDVYAGRFSMDDYVPVSRYG